MWFWIAVAAVGGVALGLIIALVLYNTAGPGGWRF